MGYFLAAWLRVRDDFSPILFNHLKKRTETLRWQIGHLTRMTRYTDSCYVNRSGRHSCDSSLFTFSVHNENQKHILRIKSIITEPMAWYELQILKHVVIKHFHLKSQYRLKFYYIFNKYSWFYNMYIFKYTLIF